MNIKSIFLYKVCQLFSLFNNFVACGVLYYNKSGFGRCEFSVYKYVLKNGFFVTNFMCLPLITYTILSLILSNYLQTGQYFVFLKQTSLSNNVRIYNLKYIHFYLCESPNKIPSARDKQSVISEGFSLSAIF